MPRGQKVPGILATVYADAVRRGVDAVEEAVVIALRDHGPQKHMALRELLRTGYCAMARAIASLAARGVVVDEAHIGVKRRMWGCVRLGPSAPYPEQSSLPRPHWRIPRRSPPPHVPNWPADAASRDRRKFAQRVVWHLRWHGTLTVGALWRQMRPRPEWSVLRPRLVAMAARGLVLLSQVPDPRRGRQRRTVLAVSYACPWPRVWINGRYHKQLWAVGP